MASPLLPTKPLTVEEFFKEPEISRHQGVSALSTGQQMLTSRGRRLGLTYASNFTVTVKALLWIGQSIRHARGYKKRREEAQ